MSAQAALQSRREIYRETAGLAARHGGIAIVDRQPEQA